MRRSSKTGGSASSGVSASARVSKDGGPVTGIAIAYFLSPRFTVNDLGFMGRANLLRLVSRLSLRDLHPSARWQRAQANFFFFQSFDARQGVNLARSVALNGNATFNNFWTAFCNSFLDLPFADDREL